MTPDLPEYPDATLSLPANDCDESQFESEADYRAFAARQLTTRERLRRARADADVKASLEYATRLRKETK